MTASAAAGGATFLFVPGDRPDRFEKAVTAGADQVVLDLEDAVEPGSKGVARRHVVSWLSGGGDAWVRVNAAGTPWHDEDLRDLRSVPGLRGVVLPKAETVEATTQVRDAIGPAVGLVALVETARGVQRSADLADSGRVDRLALGAIDLARDLGAEESDDALLLARCTLVLASRSAGLLGPIDGVTTVIDDPARITADATRAWRLGFAGKLCIHPRQLEPARAGFAPSDHEVAWARRVVEAADAPGGGAAFSLDGQMVDLPVVLRARDVLSRHATTG